MQIRPRLTLLRASRTVVSSARLHLMVLSLRDLPCHGPLDPDFLLRDLQSMVAYASNKSSTAVAKAERLAPAPRSILVWRQL